MHFTHVLKTHCDKIKGQDCSDLLLSILFKISPNRVVNNSAVFSTGVKTIMIGCHFAVVQSTFV